ncbi:MAG TPA: 6-carboxytetrahydropterin synthase [Gemmatimonadota bacterium]|nr:6-carboxytetrahydropterin synthase [Gemmatimonadota bacterium]
MPFRVTVQIHFSYGHRLLDYVGPCAHPHGHNGLVEIELESDTLDARGMVVDFADVKRDVKRWIDERLDHQMILRKDDPLVRWLTEQEEPFYVMDENPTAENIAREIFEHAAGRGYPVVAVRLWETATSFATYQNP